jgi:hypothetical protein
MRVRVPVLVKDPDVARYKGVPLTEAFVIEGEDVFLDGPISPRIAVLDFDPATGTLAPVARVSADAGDGAVLEYTLARPDALDDPAVMQVVAFGGVYKTLQMFEEADTLGRRVRWAFDGPQLLVVPRAGDWPNAFYERDSRSLQFFFFTPPGAPGPVFTCHSQDIIAHETAHAVVDGVAPDLYHAQSPESLAIHEAMADLATLIMAFRSRKLAARILDQTGGSIEHPSAFTAIAGQFGQALARNRHALRDLHNRKTMADVDRGDPHALSEVLSGALYAVMVRIYEDVRRAPETAEAPEAPDTHAAVKAEFQQAAYPAGPEAGPSAPGTIPTGRALFIASERFKRTVFRGLDYLPPGEVSFADFARAMLASDEASHPDSGAQRSWLVDEFVRRGIVSDASELDVETNFAHPAVSKVDLDELVRSDWLAYQFATRARVLLGIPKGVPFEVRPRLKVVKRYYHRDDEPVDVAECLFKVTWTETEPCAAGAGLPGVRRIARGSTLAVDWERRIVRAVVQSQPGGAGDRDLFVRRLADRDALATDDLALGPDGRPRRGVIRADTAGGVLRLYKTARALHLLGAR